jgi:hypothetical protein
MVTLLLAYAPRFVHVGTEAARLAGEPLINVDETAPLRPDSPALYSSTKARAETPAAVLAHRWTGGDLSYALIKSLGLITNFLATPWSKSWYPAGASSRVMTVALTASAMCARSLRIICISPW